MYRCVSTVAALPAASRPRSQVQPSRSARVHALRSPHGAAGARDAAAAARRNAWPRVQKEAKNIATLTKMLLKEGHPLEEIAVLYPQHRYGDAVEEELLAARVPVQRYGRNSIADRCRSSGHCEE